VTDAKTNPLGCIEWRRRLDRSALHLAPWWVGLAVLALLSSCTASRGPLVVTSPDPAVKIPAIQKAVRQRDQSAVPQLVKDLDSDDPAVRMYANHGLQQLTGQDFGYKYFDDDDQREAAAERWRQWLRERQARGNPGGSSGERSGGSSTARTASSGPS
jgi:hypothetical protein